MEHKRTYEEAPGLDFCSVSQQLKKPPQQSAAVRPGWNRERAGVSQTL